MNNEEFINKKIQKVIDIYENIENELLLKIVEHFKYNEEFLNSDYWRIKKLEEMGLFNREIINYIAKATKKTPKQIKMALKDIGYNSYNLKELNNAFKDNKLKIDPNVLIQNNILDTIINNVYDEVSERFINMSSKIAEATRNAYLNIVEETYLKTTMGTHSYQEAIREAINNLSNSGIKTLVYKTVDKENDITGIRTYDIEATARREILTGARQVNLKLNENIIAELNPEYLYISEHMRCRPTHFDWQGTIIKKEDLIPVTNYGDVTGLGGINCAHYFEPYFGDARGDELKSISKEEALKNYNISQQQRYLERGVRKWKRKAEMFKANDDVEAYSKCQDKVKEWQQRNTEFSKDNKIKRDFTREFVSESKNKAFSQNLHELNKNQKAGTFDISKYDCDIVTTTKDVVLTNERKQHIIERHHEVENYIDDISKILKEPDRVFKQLNKDDTLWIIKRFDENVKITLKLNTIDSKHKNYKNSIIQMQFMRDKEIERYINNEKIKEIFKKSIK